MWYNSFGEGPAHYKAFTHTTMKIAILQCKSKVQTKLSLCLSKYQTIKTSIA
jgi:hypothetical protein